MRTFAIITLLAFGAVNASFAPGPVDDKIEGTTTLTSTTTKTLTITECNPDKPDCPYKTPAPVSTSSAKPEEPEEPCSESYPALNTTISTGPTASVKIPSATKTADNIQPPPAGGATVPTPSRVVTNGAGSILANGGLLVGAMALGFIALN